MQARAREDLARLFAAEIGKAGLVATEIVTYATPRRLALIARDLPDATEAVAEEVKGPRASAPPQALEGFLRKTGLAREALVERDGVLFAVTERPGRATADVLAEAVPAIVRAFPWPKSMRWGAASSSTESLRWVRPLQGIVALFGEEMVPVAIAGVESGAATLGHRFHHPGVITIGGAHDYVEKLRACHGIVDQDERAAIIRDGARAAAAGAALSLVEDEGLVAENAGLTEWPVPMLGRFHPSFLGVPPEVIQLTARVNQKYFVCRQERGQFSNAFVCTANIEASDGGAKIVEGNRKVLAARLADARFFYDTDLKVPLEEQAKKLDRIVFHEKLGTVADKAERVAKLARWLVELRVVTSAEAGADGLGSAGNQERAAALDPGVRRDDEEVARLAGLAERAARLAKADLVTGMVGEFPELQGLMGGYYAAAQGEPAEVAEAIRDHYKPIGQGDEVPTAPVTVAVSLADKLDTLFSFFIIDERPTGSKDPFALRRAAVSAISIIEYNDLRFSLSLCFPPYVSHLFWKKYGDLRDLLHLERLEEAKLPISSFTAVDVAVDRQVHPDKVFHISRSLQEFEEEAQQFLNAALYVRLIPIVQKLSDFAQAIKASYLPLRGFLADRLKVQQREAGVRHDLIEAVFALGGEDDLVRLLARVRALQAFVGTEDGANLLAGYKRAANILKKEGWTTSPLPAGEEGSR